MWPAEEGAGDVLEPDRGELEGDLGRDVGAEQAVDRLGWLLPRHDEAVGQGRVVLDLLARFAAPPPMAVDVRAVRWVHQAKDGVVDAAIEGLAFGPARLGLADADLGRFAARRRGLA